MQRARNEESRVNRKQHIITCAEQIILDFGLHELSIAKVAKKSKLAVGTIYLYYENKEAIIAHLTLKSRYNLLEMFQKSILGESNALNQITNLLRAYFQFYKDYRYSNELVNFYETTVGLEEPQELVEASLKINQFVNDIIQNGKAQGLIRPELNGMEFSFLLWGTVVGIIQLMEVKKNYLTLALNTTQTDFFNSYISLIINSIKI